MYSPCYISGCINRVRQRQLGSTSVVAAWSEQGSVSIWSLDKSLQRLEEPIAVKTGDKGNNWPREETSPLYKFTGHTCEGYAVNWSEVTPGVLATGDCLKHIYTWKPTDDGSWNVDSRYRSFFVEKLPISLPLKNTLRELF